MVTTYEVPLSYTINVSLSATPQGLADFNTNSIAIFSNEEAAFSDAYRAYLTPNEVATDFGSDSLTYKMAKALFAPAPNFRTGGGYLYIFPFNGTNATPASFTTGAIAAANITALQAVTDGSLNITIDGTVNELSGINFKSISTIADVVTVLKKLNLDVDIKADGDTIIFTSRQDGSLSGITINTISDEGVVDLAGASYLNAVGGTSELGQDAGGETLAESVTRALEQVYFGGVITTQATEPSAIQTNAAAIQALDCVYFETIQSLKQISDLGAAIKSAGLGKTRLLAYSDDAETGKVAIATYASIASSVNYNGSNTMNTMNLKTLTGITGDSGLNDTYVLAAKTNGVDIYANTGGLSVVYSNDNNGYTDDIKGQLWLKKALEVAGFNYLRQVNTKIPQTEEAMTGLRNAYAQIAEKGITNGFIGAAPWNGSYPFGDSEDFAANIAEKGYYIYSLPIAQQTQTEREARKAPVVQLAVKCAGAIHFSDVIVNIQR